MPGHDFVAPSPAYWEESWQASSATTDRGAYLRACSVFDPVLARLLPGEPGHQALEVGCYPGGFMHYLGKRFGYKAARRASKSISRVWLEELAENDEAGDKGRDHEKE